MADSIFFKMIAMLVGGSFVILKLTTPFLQITCKTAVLPSPALLYNYLPRPTRI